jgi:hypothetical protein
MQKENPLKVGIVGAGVISAAYLKTKFPQFKITCCSDIQQTQAELRAREFRIAAVPTETILTDPAIDIVLNLTTPQHHAEVIGAGVRARKHVYSEKPLGRSSKLQWPTTFGSVVLPTLFLARPSRQVANCSMKAPLDRRSAEPLFS